MLQVYLGCKTLEFMQCYMYVAESSDFIRGDIEHNVAQLHVHCITNVQAYMYKDN